MGENNSYEAAKTISEWLIVKYNMSKADYRKLPKIKRSALQKEFTLDTGRQTDGYPEYVALADGSKILYRELIDHEKAIIEDNLFYGLKTGCTDEEIDAYVNEANVQLKNLRQAIFENPFIVIRLDETTERYVPALTVIQGGLSDA